MKLTIQAAPGELEEKADLVLERMLQLLPQDGLVSDLRKALNASRRGLAKEFKEKALRNALRDAKQSYASKMDTALVQIESVLSDAVKEANSRDAADGAMTKGLSSEDDLFAEHGEDHVEDDADLMKGSLADVAANLRGFHKGDAVLCDDPGVLDVSAEAYGDWLGRMGAPKSVQSRQKRGVLTGPMFLKEVVRAARRASLTTYRDLEDAPVDGGESMLKSISSLPGLSHVHLSDEIIDRHAEQDALQHYEETESEEPISKSLDSDGFDWENGLQDLPSGPEALLKSFKAANPRMENSVIGAWRIPGDEGTIVELSPNVGPVWYSTSKLAIGSSSDNTRIVRVDVPDGPIPYRYFYKSPIQLPEES